MNGSTLRSWLVSVSTVLTVVACGGGGAGPTAAPPSPAATAVPGPTAEASAAATAGASRASSAPTVEPTSGKIYLKAYFVHYGNVDGPTPSVPVSRESDGTVAVARAAMEHLLAGPTEAERAHDLQVGTIGTRIPDGTRLLRLDVADGIATVDLSSEFAAGIDTGEAREGWAYRLAQVTYTLTQFPTVQRVRFLVDGKPGIAIEGHEGTPLDLAARAAYLDQLPAIFVDEPAWDGAFGDRLVVSGLAQLVELAPQFEAALAVRGTDEILARQTVRAGCTTGCWQPPGGGVFEFEMEVPSGTDRSDLILMVWVESSDGGQSHAMAYPIH